MKNGQYNAKEQGNMRILSFVSLVTKVPKSSVKDNFDDDYEREPEYEIYWLGDSEVYEKIIRRYYIDCLITKHFREKREWIVQGYKLNDYFYLDPDGFLNKPDGEIVIRDLVWIKLFWTDEGLLLESADHKIFFWDFNTKELKDLNMEMEIVETKKKSCLFKYKDGRILNGKLENGKVCHLKFVSEEWEDFIGVDAFTKDGGFLASFNDGSKAISKKICKGKSENEYFYSYDDVLDFFTVKSNDGREFNWYLIGNSHHKYIRTFAWGHTNRVTRFTGQGYIEKF